MSVSTPIILRTDLHEDLEDVVRGKRTWKSIHDIDKDDILYEMARNKDIQILKYLVPRHVAPSELFFGEQFIEYLNKIRWTEGFEYVSKLHSST